jgi:hypothetical protein
VWLLAGGIVGAAIVVGLLRSRSPWLPRIVWLVHGLRLPALIDGAFFAGADAKAPTAFYLAAIVAVMVNLWMLARAGWDL